MCLQQPTSDSSNHLKRTAPSVGKRSGATMSPAACIFLFLTYWVTVMAQAPPPAFPPQSQDFNNTVKKMMTMCSSKGFPLPVLRDTLMNSSSVKPAVSTNPVTLFPSLISSLSSYYTFVPFSTLKATQDPASNITDSLLRAGNLTQSIDLIINTTDKTSCFFRAMLAPLAWGAVFQNSSQFDIISLRKLLWAAKPFVEVQFGPIPLPQSVPMAQLVELMIMFNDEFSFLSNDQKDQIRQWMKSTIINNDPTCTLSPKTSLLASILNPLLPAKPALFNSLTPGCPPKMPWLTANNLRMMGRFILRLPDEEVKAIPSTELCSFYQSPDFPMSFKSMGNIDPRIGQILLQRLKKECFTSNQTLANQMDRLGSLACFFDEAQTLNANLSRKLLSQLGNCDFSGSDMLMRTLVQKLTTAGSALTADMLQSLGFGISTLSPSTLSNMSLDTLNRTMSSLSQVNWNLAQAKVLTQKILGKPKNITGNMLLSLGTMVLGVDTDILKKVRSQGLLGTDGLKNMSDWLSSLQKKALLVGMQVDANATDLVQQVPDSLVSFLSLSTLDKAAFTSVDQLQGRSWTNIQSLFLLKKVSNGLIRIDQIRKLGLTVQGLTCGMIQNISDSDTLETAQILDASLNLLTRMQIRCMALKLFQSLELQRTNYFANISDSELQAIPSTMLIYLPVPAIRALPNAVCPRFLQKMNQANMSSLPNSAPSRFELRNKALSCLGKSASDLSPAEVLYLGPLVCELDPSWMAALNPTALNVTLQAMTACRNIPKPFRGPLFSLLLQVYGDPSTWSVDTMTAMGPLLLLNDTVVSNLPTNTAVKTALTNLLQSLQSMLPDPENPPPEEFRPFFNLLALQQKLFQLKTALPALRRRRAALSTVTQPTLSMIQDLGMGNVYWTPAQLGAMTAQTFLDGMSILGDVTNYSPDQLQALANKTAEALGDVSKLNESKIVEMGCITQGLSATKLQNLNIYSLDTLNLLSVCPYTQDQMQALWQGFTQRTGINVASLAAVDLSGLGNLICGLQPQDISALNTAAFKDAMADISQAQCSPSTMTSLMQKSVSVFGDPSTWGEAVVSSMGNVIASLSPTQLASLNPSVLPFISQPTMSLIPPACLAALSVSQLKALGPDNAAALTPSQFAAMSPAQMTAVQESIGVAIRDAVILPQTGGAPIHGMLGLTVLLQPLFLLLLGYIH